MTWFQTIAVACASAYCLVGAAFACMMATDRHMQSGEKVLLGGAAFITWPFFIPLKILIYTERSVSTLFGIASMISIARYISKREGGPLDWAPVHDQLITLAGCLIAFLFSLIALIALAGDIIKYAIKDGLTPIRYCRLRAFFVSESCFRDVFSNKRWSDALSLWPPPLVPFIFYLQFAFSYPQDNIGRITDLSDNLPSSIRRILFRALAFMPKKFLAIVISGRDVHLSYFCMRNPLVQRFERIAAAHCIYKYCFSTPSSRSHVPDDVLGALITWGSAQGPDVWDVYYRTCSLYQNDTSKDNLERLIKLSTEELENRTRASASKATVATASLSPTPIPPTIVLPKEKPGGIERKKRRRNR